MVVLNKIYTRTGDAGLTALGIGERVPKHSLRIASYGTVDETNAFIGMARLHLVAAPKLDAMLGRVQNDLFDLGADLTTPEREGKQRRERCASASNRSSAWKRKSTSSTPSWRRYVLRAPRRLGGRRGAARRAHRCRRAERGMVALANQPDEHVSAPALKYINRLSDLLFVASRYANERGGGDILWVPGQNR